LAPVLAAVALLLTGCVPDGAAEVPAEVGSGDLAQVTVDVGELRFPIPFAVEQTQVRVLQPGNGELIPATGLLSCFMTVYNGRTGERLDSAVVSGELDIESLGADLRAVLAGQELGSDFIVAIRDPEGFGADGSAQPGDTVLFGFQVYGLADDGSVTPAVTPPSEKSLVPGATLALAVGTPMRLEIRVDGVDTGQEPTSADYYGVSELMLDQERLREALAGITADVIEVTVTVNPLALDWMGVLAPRHTNVRETTAAAVGAVSSLPGKHVSLQVDSAKVDLGNGSFQYGYSSEVAKAAAKLANIEGLTLPWITGMDVKLASKSLLRLTLESGCNLDLISGLANLAELTCAPGENTAAVGYDLLGKLKKLKSLSYVHPTDTPGQQALTWYVQRHPGSIELLNGAPLPATPDPVAQTTQIRQFFHDTMLQRAETVWAKARKYKTSGSISKVPKNYLVCWLSGNTTDDIVPSDCDLDVQDAYPTWELRYLIVAYLEPGEEVGIYTNGGSAWTGLTMVGVYDLQKQIKYKPKKVATTQPPSTVQGSLGATGRMDEDKAQAYIDKLIKGS
jgi:hypothetical protein